MQLFCELNGDNWYECTACSFLQKEVNIETLKHLSENNMSKRENGFREYWLATMLHHRFELNKILLVGTGYSCALARLLEKERLLKDTDMYYGCDIDSAVLEERRETFGTDRFFHCMDIPYDVKFNGLIFIEVFEHIPFPKETMNYYLNHLSKRAIIAISTDFYPGPGYGGLSPRSSYANKTKHVSYWNEKSFMKLGQELQLYTVFFDMEFASVYSKDPKDINPKTKFPNRRTCFMCNNDELYKGLKRFREECPLLPINRA